MSACSFSTVPWSGRTVMLRHAWPKRIDAVPISTWWEVRVRAGVSQSFSHYHTPSRELMA